MSRKQKLQNWSQSPNSFADLQTSTKKVLRAWKLQSRHLALFMKIDMRRQWFKQNIWHLWAVCCIKLNHSRPSTNQYFGTIVLQILGKGRLLSVNRVCKWARAIHLSYGHPFACSLQMKAFFVLQICYAYPPPPLTQTEVSSRGRRRRRRSECQEVDRPTRRRLSLPGVKMRC